MTSSVDARGPAGVTGEVDHEVLIGEIHTGILQSMAPATVESVSQLLGFGTHQPALNWERPVRQAESQEVLSGVDCVLPLASGTNRRGVGTLAAAASVTAGRVLQVSTRSRLSPATVGRRLTWSHYLARPGAIEVLGELPEADLVDGFLGWTDRHGALDPGQICAGLFNEVQSSGMIDGRAPLRAARTRLRWSATPVPAGEPGAMRFHIGTDGRRTLRLTAPSTLLGRLGVLCRDVALHDWLLSCLISTTDGANIGGREQSAVIGHLRPVVDHLLHLWMPGARLPRELVRYWDELEHLSGLSRQWRTLVHRIRDQLLLATMQHPPRAGEVLELRPGPNVAVR